MKSDRTMSNSLSCSRLSMLVNEPGKASLAVACLAIARQANIECKGMLRSCYSTLVWCWQTCVPKKTPNWNHMKLQCCEMRWVNIGLDGLKQRNNPNAKDSVVWYVVNMAPGASRLKLLLCSTLNVLMLFGRNSGKTVWSLKLSCAAFAESACSSSGLLKGLPPTTSLRRFVPARSSRTCQMKWIGRSNACQCLSISIQRARKPLRSLWNLSSRACCVLPQKILLPVLPSALGEPAKAALGVLSVKSMRKMWAHFPGTWYEHKRHMISLESAHSVFDQAHWTGWEHIQSVDQRTVETLWKLAWHVVHQPEGCWFAESFVPPRQTAVYATKETRS